MEPVSRRFGRPEKEQVAGEQYFQSGLGRGVGAGGFQEARVQG